MKKLYIALFVLLLQIFTLQAVGCMANETDQADDLIEEVMTESDEELAEAELTYKVIEVLDNDFYKAAYDNLRKGEVLKKGKSGDTVMGLQILLMSFGKPVEVDGYMGKQTRAYMNEVQAAFGLKQTKKLKRAGFAKLLYSLLCYQDEEKAYELLSYDYGYSYGGNEFEYMLGCAQFLKGKFYSAKRNFEWSEWEDWEERAARCVQEWPQTGVLWRNDNVPGSDMSLTIQFNNDYGSAMLVKIFTADDVPASTMFIAGNSSAVTYLPGGTYKIKDGTGKNWYGLEEAFGDEGYYETMTFENDETNVYLQSGGMYQLTVNAEELNPDATSVGSEYENWENF